MSLSVKGSTIRMFGVVGEEYTAEDFQNVIDEMEGDITLRIQSPGGHVSEGHSIHNQLMDYPGRVRVEVDGIAASIASVIMLGGDEVVVRKNSLVMVHDPWVVALGDATELRALADVLDILGRQVAQLYADKAGGSVDDWLKIMANETYFSGEEAVEIGLADAVLDAETKANAKAMAPVATAKAFPRVSALKAKQRQLKLKADLTRLWKHPTK